jgi:YegS/Rv2252/BmrU family lipid kinase
MQAQQSEWLVIVNPNAGSRKGKKDWTKIAALLTSEHFNYEAVFTEGIGHAIRLSQEKILAGYRKIIVVGGDGTLNEVVNGMFNQQLVETSAITLGMIPVGTGNDWGKMFRLSKIYKKAVEIIREGKTVIQDAGLVTYENSVSGHKRYFVNAAGIGFDAEVVSRTNFQKQHGHSGLFLYLLNLIRSLFSYRARKVNIDVDGIAKENEVFSVSVGICKYSGGGMIQSPNAIMDDGLLDVTVIKKIGKFDIIRSLPKLFNGTIGTHPKVELLRGKTVLIEGTEDIFLETDGESLGHSPFRFEVVPSCVRVITG